MAPGCGQFQVCLAASPLFPSHTHTAHATQLHRSAPERRGHDGGQIGGPATLRPTCRGREKHPRREGAQQDQRQRHLTALARCVFVRVWQAEGRGAGSTSTRSGEFSQSHVPSTLLFSSVVTHTSPLHTHTHPSISPSAPHSALLRASSACVCACNCFCCVIDGAHARTPPHSPSHIS